MLNRMTPTESGGMNTWQFSTTGLAKAKRWDAWQGAMAQLHLPSGKTAGGEDFFGTVSCLVSPMGIEFARIDSRAQTMSGRSPNQAAAIWLCVLLDGKATLSESSGDTSLGIGDVIFGPTDVEATLTFETDFQCLFIKAPRVALGPRLIAPLSPRIGHLSDAIAVNHVFSGMLRAAADVLESLTSVQLRPVELALTEFLITCLAAEDKPIARGGAAGARAAHLHRICQTIETMLGDPKLTLANVAAEHGVSPRYLQKLFASVGQAFSHYVRTRRLERCRADLISPLHAQLSISQICFRWGFNGSAHFSHAFRDQYGLSPREYRRTARL
ncbi:MAG TPA: helix-turn-helix domain-containing protein [Rhizomicrobium sp.]|jgi:AraC-like DNA-binding protein|nr:helix-turn-helix domain-containing protein [Rhizomicrobium sp.]